MMGFWVMLLCLVIAIVLIVAGVKGQLAVGFKRTLLVIGILLLLVVIYGATPAGADLIHSIS